MPEEIKVDSLEVNDSIIDKLETEHDIMVSSNSIPQAAPLNPNGVNDVVTAINYLVTIADTVHDVTDPSSPGGAKITLPEYASFFPIAMKTPSFISALPNIPAELSAQITESEALQLADAISAAKYLREDANIEQAVKDGLALANQLKNFIQTYFVKK